MKTKNHNLNIEQLFGFADKTKSGKSILNLSSITLPAQQAGNVRIENGVEIHRFKKELIKTGDYKKGSMSLSITDETLDHLAAQFALFTGGGNKVPIPSTHDTTGNPDNNNGWLVDVFRDGHSLFGIIDLIGVESPKLALSSDVSLYIPPEYTDGNGITYHRPITHVALCTNPVITGLKGFEVIAASLSDNSNLGDTNMDLKKLAGLLGVNVADGDDNAKIESAIEAAIKALKDDAAKVKTADEKNVSLSADIKKLTDEKTALSLSLSGKTPDPMIVKLTSENRGIKLNALVQASKITPAVKDKLASVYSDEAALTLSLAKGDDNFDKVISALAENNVVELGEKTKAQVIALSNSNMAANSNPLTDEVNKRTAAAK